MKGGCVGPLNAMYFFFFESILLLKNLETPGCSFDTFIVLYVVSCFLSLPVPVTPVLKVGGVVFTRFAIKT